MAVHGTKSWFVPPAEWGGVKLDSRAVASWHDGTVTLPASEAFILSALLRAQGAPLHRRRILSALYDGDPDGGPLYAETGLTVRICRMRKKLEHSPVKIETKSCLGYYLALRSGEHTRNA